jgi:hypothetical protein
MAQNSSQLMIGPVEFFLAPESVAIPVPTGSVADFAGWDTPGYTSDGLEADHTTTPKEIRADEETDPIDVIIDKETNGLSVKLIQTTMQNIYYSLAGATMPDADTITFGGKVRPNIWRGGFLSSQTREGKKLELIMFRLYAKTAVKVKLQRTSEAIWQCNFVALADPTQPTGSRTGIYKYVTVA